MLSNRVMSSVSQASPIRTSRKNLFTVQRLPASRPLVLHMTAALDYAPQARTIADLAIMTQRQGWRTAIASSGGPLAVEVERAAVRHVKLPRRSGLLGSWQARLDLQNFLLRERVALIHLHNLAQLPLAARLAQSHHLPLLLDINAATEVDRRVHKWLQHPALRQAKIRVSSTFMARFAREQLKLPQPGLYQIPPGIDLQWYAPTRVTPERLHKLSHLWRLPEQATIILTAAPLIPGNGQLELLQALANIKRPDLFVVMVGEDNGTGHRAVIEQHVKQLGLEGRVVMPGHCPDWPAACWLAGLVVALNTTPRGEAPELLAAQALGRPVIVTDCGANAEMVKSGETAWLIAPNDAAQLDVVLREAVSMTEAQRIELSHRTRDFVRSLFSQQDWLDSMIELYATILEQPMEAYAHQQPAAAMAS